MGTVLLIILVLLLKRGATSLALQFWLGILVQWRTRFDSFGYTRHRFDETHLNDRA